MELGIGHKEFPVNLLQGRGMVDTCTFVFRGSLNDFLRAGKKDKEIVYGFQPSATVKDAIEAIGIPHVEVARMLVNENHANFSYRIQPNDKIEVLPFETVSLSLPIKFVLDVHLGKLARLLRLLGFDTHYQTDYDDPQIIALAVEQDRIVLTRDVGLLKHKVLLHGYWPRSQNSEEQLKEVIKRFGLCDYIQNFTRCLACNGILVEVQKETVRETIPPKTSAFFHQFYQCNLCRKIYWKGSHYENMLQQIERIRSVACQVRPAAL